MNVEKKKYNNILKVILIFIITIIMLGTKAFADEVESYINIDKLTFDVNIKENGDVEVTENWIVTLENVNLISKKFVRDNTFDSIKDVEVIEYLAVGSELPFHDVHEFSDTLAKDTFFSAINPKKSATHEITWGANQKERAERRFKIKYTIDKIIVKHNDCAELNWRFISENFDIPISVLMGTIKIPDNSILEEEVKVWSHSDVNSSAIMVSNNSVYFEASTIENLKYFGIRFLFPLRVIQDNNNVRLLDANSFERIVKEENELKNEKDNVQLSEEIVIKNVIVIIINILILFFIKHKITIIADYPRLDPDIDYDYFKNIPEESATPAEVLKLINRKKLKKDIFFPTLLSLILKGWIDIEVKSVKKDDIIFKMKEEGIVDKNLDEEELYIYLCNINKEEFSLKTFEKYGIKNYRLWLLLKKEIIREAEVANINKQYIDQDKVKKMKLVNLLIIFDLLLIFLGLPLIINLGCKEILIVLYIMLVLVDLFNSIIIKVNMNDRTQEGTNIMDKWLAFKSYMQGFGVIDKKKLPNLKEWEKFLVFATAFEIEDKVIENLRYKFSELNGPIYKIHHRNYRILDILCDEKIGDTVIANIKESINTVTNFAYKHNTEVMRSSAFYNYVQKFKKDDWL